MGVVFVSAFTNGTVTLAPFVDAEAPRYPSWLALGPRVTVLEQPDAVRNSAPTISVISVFFMCWFKNRLLRLRNFGNP